MKTRTTTFFFVLLVIIITGCTSAIKSGTVTQSEKSLSGSSSLDCASLLTAEEVSSTCTLANVEQKKEDAIEGKYYNVCARRFLAGKDQKLYLDAVQASKEVFEAGYSQRSETGALSSIKETKRIEGIGEAAYQFKDGKTFRIEFRKNRWNFNLESKFCNFEQLKSLARLVQSRA